MSQGRAHTSNSNWFVLILMSRANASTQTSFKWSWRAWNASCAWYGHGSASPLWAATNWARGTRPFGYLRTHTEIFPSSEVQRMRNSHGMRNTGVTGCSRGGHEKWFIGGHLSAFWIFQFDNYKNIVPSPCIFCFCHEVWRWTSDLTFFFLTKTGPSQFPLKRTWNLAFEYFLSVFLFLLGGANPINHWQWVSHQ